MDSHPWGLLRGLIHADGCRIVNWATCTTNGITRCHEYPRYFLTNKSPDILRLFTATLDAVGVLWKARDRPTGSTDISIAHRDSVALLDRHIDPKY
ncbi:hypothetical protein [Kitasatospora acidiphila]|uniref:hypothetical protein n=1 Tax=Kitasatospora acidiphila TaxID=2567942 RepID=UPI002B40033D|nr:hypothetical protein [Kitasatospora acidiphila]